MPEIEAIKAKSFEETTMAEAIVLFLACVEDKKGKRDALERISYLRAQEEKKKENKNNKTMSLGLIKE